VPLDQQEHDAPDWVAFVIISAGVILHMVVIGWAGFIIASTLLFVMIARGFGSRRIVRDAIIAIVLATVVFFIFTLALGLSLPKGPFGGS
jgi:putative tricarboxylic transport membrane protein